MDARKYLPPFASLELALSKCPHHPNLITFPSIHTPAHLLSSDSPIPPPSTRYPGVVLFISLVIEFEGMYRLLISTLLPYISSFCFVEVYGSKLLGDAAEVQWGATIWLCWVGRGEGRGERVFEEQRAGSGEQRAGRGVWGR